MTKTYQEIGRNLSALEAFPKQWVREVGDRIRIPVKSDMSVWAFLWYEAGLSAKQIRNLVGKRNGNLCTRWQIEEMIKYGRQRLYFHETVAALRLDRKEAYWREKWRQYKGRRKWRKVTPVKDQDLS